MPHPPPTHPLEETSREAFERIARLARRVLDVAAMSLFVHDQDGWRQRFSTEPLFDNDDARARFIEALPKDDILVVEDARDEPLFDGLDLADHAPQLCFLAGVPLVSEAARHASGLLLVSHDRRRPVPLPQEDQQSLQDIAALIGGYLGVRSDHRKALDTARQFEQLTENLQEREQLLQEKQAELEEMNVTLAQRKRRFETLVNLLPLFVVIKDYHGRLLLSNQTHTETFLRSAPAERPLSIYDFVEPREVADAIIRADQQVIDTGRTLRTEREVVVDGETRTMDVMKVKYDDWEPGVDAVLGVVTDITELKTRERELAEKSQQLEHLVEELRRSNRQLEHFAYVASHDLQEPLRMVTAFLSLLAEEYQDQLDEDADEYIGFAVDGARRMKEMINALLTYSRMRTTAEPFGPVDLTTLVGEVRAMSLAAHADIDLQITYDELPRVHGRQSQLERLFTNLFSNAVKYAGDDPPQIHVGCESRGQQWLFAVEDNGVGVREDQRERIFDIFVRGSAAHEAAGTGIGLAICSTIVEEHGGKIWVEPAEEHGSTFLFTLTKPSHGDTP